MSKEENIVNEGGINGSGTSFFNISDEELDILDKKVKAVYQNQTSEQKLKNKITSLRYKMEDYLEQNDSEKLILVGNFIKEILDIINIKNKVFAEYIGLSKQELSKVINGRRKLNSDLALKIGSIFNIDPYLWLDIQNKNELFMLKKESNQEYKRYKLEDLLTKK